ncbi:hypothetical protein [Streptomyces cyaneofuscatus]|uniref:hypothetical protein n=1 Tax=Streptomyces cyaneofuscatus TaxID=66883 RepID=UPI0036DCB116
MSKIGNSLTAASLLMCMLLTGCADADSTDSESGRAQTSDGITHLRTGLSYAKDCKPVNGLWLKRETCESFPDSINSAFDEARENPTEAFYAEWSRTYSELKGVFDAVKDQCEDLGFASANEEYCQATLDSLDFLTQVNETAREAFGETPKSAPEREGSKAGEHAKRILNGAIKEIKELGKEAKRSLGKVPKIR